MIVAETQRSSLSPKSPTSPKDQLDCLRSVGHVGSGSFVGRSELPESEACPKSTENDLVQKARGKKKQNGHLACEARGICGCAMSICFDGLVLLVD